MNKAKISAKLFKAFKIIAEVEAELRKSEDTDNTVLQRLHDVAVATNILVGDVALGNTK